MAVRRCRCGYTTDDVFADGCPLCLRPMALVNAAGPADLYGPRVGRHIRWKLLFIVVAIGISSLTALSLELFSLNRGPAAAAPVADSLPNLKADSTGRIRVGMHIGRVAKELEPVPLKNNQPIGKTLEEALPRDSTATGTLICRKGRRQLFVSFEEGYVTAVREVPAPDRQDDWALVAFDVVPPPPAERP